MKVAVPERPGWDAAHHTAAVADRSACGRLALTGRDRVVHLHRLCTNEVRKLAPGQGASAVLTTEKGRIKDLVTVLCRPDDFLLLTSEGTGSEVKAWIERFVIREKVDVQDLSPSLAQLLCIGPRAAAAVQEATGVPLPETRWHASEREGIVGLLGERWVGHAAVHLLMPVDRRPDVLAALGRAGAPLLDPATLDAVRIASGVPARPAELNDERNPWEARLDGSIDLDKGCYIGQEVIARLDTYKKVSRALVRLDLQGEPGGVGDAARLPLSRDGRDVGYATSLARDPAEGRLVGLGYLSGELAEPGTEVTVGGVVARVTPVEPWARAAGA